MDDAFLVRNNADKQQKFELFCKKKILQIVVLISDDSVVLIIVSSALTTIIVALIVGILFLWHKGSVLLLIQT